MATYLWVLISLFAAIAGFAAAWFTRKNAIDTLNADLDAAKERYQALQSEHGDSLAAKEALEKKQQALLDERTRLNDDIKNLKAAIPSKDASIAQLQEERKGLNASLLDWQAKYRSVEGILQEKTTKLNRLEKELPSLRERVDELEGKFARKDIEAKEAIQRATSLKADFDRVLQERQSYSAQLTHFKDTQANKLIELETANSSLLEEQQKMAAQIRELSTTNGEVILENNKMKAQLENLQRQLTDALRSKEKLDYRFLALERENEQLKSKSASKDENLG